jgi:hypothetical protein
MKYNNVDIDMQQDAVELLLGGIKAKIGIINAYKHQDTHNSFT